MVTYPHISTYSQRKKVAKKENLWIMMENSSLRSEFTTLTTVLRGDYFFYPNLNILKSKSNTTKNHYVSVTFLNELTGSRFIHLLYIPI